MKIGYFLINLDDSTDRLAAATHELDKQGIEFLRISAFDGRNVTPTSITDYDEKKALAYMGRVLLGGELGCYFSHLNSAKQFLATDFDYAVVLEDDMVIRSDLQACIQQIVSSLNQSGKLWDLVNIGANKRKIFTVVDTIENHQVLHAHYFPMTTTGLLWSRQGAAKFVSEHSRIYAPVDNFFRDWLTQTNTGFSVWPALVVASGAESEIDKSSTQNTGTDTSKTDKNQTDKKLSHKRKTRKKIKRHPLYGLIKQKRLWGDKAKAFKHKYTS